MLYALSTQVFRWLFGYREMSHKNSRVLVIALEGADYCGKTTQIRLLTEKFTKINTIHTLFREPGGTDVSEKIRDILLTNDLKPTSLTELLLYYTARAQLLEELLMPLLEDAEPKVILYDRFSGASFAYQMYGRLVVNLFGFMFLDTFVCKGFHPDITFYLRIPIKTLWERKMAAEQSTHDRLEREDKAFFERVIAGYEHAQKFFPGWVPIDGTQTIEVVFNTIWQHIIPRLRALY